MSGSSVILFCSSPDDFLPHCNSITTGQAQPLKSIPNDRISLLSHKLFRKKELLSYMEGKEELKPLAKRSFKRCETCVFTPSLSLIGRQVAQPSQGGASFSVK